MIAAVLALQDYVLAHKDQIEEVEINPLIVTPNAAIAADALIRIGQLDDTDSRLKPRGVGHVFEVTIDRPKSQRD